MKNIGGAKSLSTVITTECPPSRMDTFNETTKAILHKVPNLSQLRYLGQEGDSEVDLVRVIQEVPYKWKELEDWLGFSPGESEDSAKLPTTVYNPAVAAPGFRKGGFTMNEWCACAISFRARYVLSARSY